MSLLLYGFLVSLMLNFALFMWGHRELRRREEIEFLQLERELHHAQSSSRNGWSTIVVIAAFALFLYWVTALTS